MKIENSQRDVSFIEDIERISGQKVADCYQCGKCSAGCPVGYAMELLPDKIIRFVQLGMKDEVLKSATPWLCASCETCAARCPQEVELSRVMEAVRTIAVREGASAPGGAIASFYSIFKNNVNRFGRVFEPMMAAQFNLYNRRPFQDMLNAPTLFRKGKMALRPNVPEGMAELRKIFERAKSEDK